MKNSFSLWVIAILITLSSVVYQRKTGPTYPVDGSIQISGETVEYSLLRSHETTSDAVIEILDNGACTGGEMRWRRYKSHDEWIAVPIQRTDSSLIASVPKQPAAGKVMYEITLLDEAGNMYDLSPEPVVMRFKGPVPLSVLIPHVLFMFTAMFLSTRTGLEAIAKRSGVHRYAMVTTVLLFAGGLVLGPIVQKYAFDAYWTGWPFGHDLTDNKTIIAFIVWLIALWHARRPGMGRAWIVVASVVMLAVYLVPHSVLGSEIDYTATE